MTRPPRRIVIAVAWATCLLGLAHRSYDTREEKEEMGLFADDKAQDARLDALEQHLRALTETVHRMQIDFADLRISTLGLQKSVEKKLDAKLSVADVDPSFVALHDKLAEARKQADEMTSAAEEGWAKLEGATREAMDKLRARVQEASDRSKKA
jgi:predicted RNase H-like nuclease (RuvC/YqgF family)